LAAGALDEIHCGSRIGTVGRNIAGANDLRSRDAQPRRLCKKRLGRFQIAVRAAKHQQRPVKVDKTITRTIHLDLVIP
jgi:hypothetical protein